MRRVAIRRSPIHGKGVFALRSLAAGERLLEYRGLVTTWREAADHCSARAHEEHTFLFGLSDGRVIDGGRGGNSARWLNHACDANCEAVEESGRVFIEATRTIKPGEELFIDYSLELPRSDRRKARDIYRCQCGARSCRGTMLRGT
ncbi:SET domain-containing protein-lysine N-methyltransferase [Paraburkholderia sp. Ac-20347]|uniref:SET domain-containing protein n=1 Tax=Paraburkholderia sp. Ac-20347 TaxID=2703892 RepID=UPI00197D07F4|nr:SET domain-containing protein-lysine N-methyltransferase [Paraburkholderia sp. Ac-20347]MBN3809959.1 SET domain-containing protein [Paraburkholderia sp. Ac-20347]